MEPWSARDDRPPHLMRKPSGGGSLRWVALAVLILAAAMGAYYYYFVSTHVPAPAPVAQPVANRPDSAVGT